MVNCVRMTLQEREISLLVVILCRRSTFVQIHLSTTIKITHGGVPTTLSSYTSETMLVILQGNSGSDGKGEWSEMVGACVEEG